MSKPYDSKAIPETPLTIYLLPFYSMWERLPSVFSPNINKQPFLSGLRTSLGHVYWYRFTQFVSITFAFFPLGYHFPNFCDQLVLGYMISLWGELETDISKDTGLRATRQKHTCNKNFANVRVSHVFKHEELVLKWLPALGFHCQCLSNLLTAFK